MRAKNIALLLDRGPLDPHLANGVFFLINTNPVPNAMFLGSNAHASASAANDQIARSIAFILLHPSNHTPMDPRVLGYVSHLATRQGPADRLPRPVVGREIQSSEREVLHYLPSQDCCPAQPALKHEGVVDARR